MNLSTLLALRNPVLSILNFLISRALPIYEPFSYKKCVLEGKRMIWLRYLMKLHSETPATTTLVEDHHNLDANHSERRVQYRK